MKTQNEFQGFSPAALQFLGNVRQNNNKSWYEANKETYQETLVKPFHALIGELTPFMLTIDFQFAIAPVHRMISRIYRDTRFSKDKSRYRDAMWLTFKRFSEDWKQVPAYFFEIIPEWYRFGMGFYDATPKIMQEFRKQIDEHPEQFLEVIKFYKSNSNLFRLEGDLYKKQLKHDHSPDIAEWYQRKSFYLTCQKEISVVLFDSGLVVSLKDGYQLLAPLYRYLWEVIARTL